MARNFDALTEREILALAITLEEEDQRVYADFADGLGETYPATAKIFAEMAEEESRHRVRLIKIHRERFGEHIPHIRREDVKGFLRRKPVWLVRPLGINVVRKQAEVMELEARRFYERAAERATDASIRKLLGDLASRSRSIRRTRRLSQSSSPRRRCVRRNRWRSAGCLCCKLCNRA
jgi:erythrin-vacuolar iron transport family protein